MTDNAMRLAPIRPLVERLLLGSGVASMALAVAHGGDILWEDAVGWADRERRIPATPHTMYSLASISKPITATALMTLVERGAILEHSRHVPIRVVLGKKRQPRMLEPHVVIVGKTIEARHAVAVREQPARQVKADESSGAGDEDFLTHFFAPWQVLALGKRSRRGQRLPPSAGLRGAIWKTRPAL